MEHVLRIVYRCIVFSEFYDGLPFATSCQKDAQMYCHTWAHLPWRIDRVTFDLHRCSFANSKCIFETLIVSYVCEYMHDSSGTWNQNHTALYSSNLSAVHRELSDGRHYGSLPTIY